MALTHTPDISVNGRLISAATIDEEIQYHPAESRRQAMVKAAETLIIGELLSQRAHEKGLSDTIERNSIDKQPDLLDALLELEVPAPNATEQECQRYFKANADKFTTSPMVEASHILLVAEPKDLQQRAHMHNLALNLIQQIQDKQASFVELVRTYSMCPSKEVDGSLGQLSKGQTVSEFERQVFAAEIGLMPCPVESRYGYHIVMVVHKVAGKPLAYNMVKDKIAQYLNKKVQRKAISQYLQQLVSEADIKGFEFDLDASLLLQ